MDPDLMDDQQRERYNALIRTITNANTEALTSAQENLQFQSIGKKHALKNRTSAYQKKYSQCQIEYYPD